MCPVGGTVNWWKPLWKTVWWFLKKLKVELPYNPEISLLGIYLKKSKMLIQKDNLWSSSSTFSPQDFFYLFIFSPSWSAIAPSP